VSPASGGTAGNSLGEQWLDTSGGTYVFKIWDGAAWRSEAGEFVNVTGDTMTGAFGIVAGDASTPGLFFSGDANSGLYSPGADQVAISTGGSGRLFVDANGNVGVGAAPVVVFAGQTHLTVNHSSGGTTVAGINLATDGTRRASLITYPSNSEALRITAESTTLPITVHTNGTERLRITSAGLVGIGTSSPGRNLHVAGSSATALIESTGSTNADLLIGDGGVRYYGIRGVAGGGSLQIRNDTANTTLATFTSTGLVGIGTTAVSSRLHVLNLSGGSSTTEVSTVERDNSGYFLKLYRNAGSGNTGGLIGADSAGTYYTGGHNTQNMIYIDAGNGVMQFYTNNAERARIDSSGRLLVGTSTSSGAPSSGAVIQLADQFSVRAGNGGGITNRVATTASATTLNCVIDVAISSNIYSSFIGTLYICQQLTDSSKSFLAEYRVKIYNSGSTAVFTLVDSVDNSSPNNVALTFAYSNSNRQITATSTWTTATSSVITCTLVGAGANA
jgi:hypothetical protein